ncbi:MAG: DUF899 domain-containing protein [Gammaproteobacteria bacterium]
MADYPLPDVVSLQQWQEEVDRLRLQEKALTRLADAVSARRRRLPMVRIAKDYQFIAPQGHLSFLDLFEGRRQLIVYHFMFDADWDAGCDGCSWVTDAMSHPAHLQARDASLVLVSKASIDKLQAYQKRMGWEKLTWVSSLGSDFNQDMGATDADGETALTSVFLRSDANEIYRTYYTDGRGIEHLGSHWTYLDLTPYGRQEHWEDSPKGSPQTPAHWTRRHDEYER